MLSCCEYCVNPCIGIQRETGKWRLRTTWTGQLIMGDTIVLLFSGRIGQANEFSFFLRKCTTAQTVLALQGSARLLCQQLGSPQPLEAIANCSEVIGRSISLGPNRISHKSRCWGYKLHCARATCRNASDGNTRVFGNIRFLCGCEIWAHAKYTCRTEAQACLGVKHVLHTSLELLRISTWSSKGKPAQQKAERIDGKERIHDGNAWIPNPIAPEANYTPGIFIWWDNTLIFFLKPFWVRILSFATESWLIQQETILFPEH